MTFSSTVKEELLRLPLGRTCCMLSELGALTQTSGQLSLQGGGKIHVIYRVENPALARRIFQLLKERLGLSPELQVVQGSRMGGRKQYTLVLSDADSKVLLQALQMMEPDGAGALAMRRRVARFPLSRQCCRKSFLRAAFLGGGTMSAPEKGYHLEWSAEELSVVQSIEKVLEKSGINGRIYQRKGRHVIYLKDGQQIADVLALMGASAGLLSMENIRISRQLRGNANRAANCDQHNGVKAVLASDHQVELIRRYQAAFGLDTLPRPIREMAKLRLQNRDLSLSELGQLMIPPLSKSGVAYRMAKLEQLLQQQTQQEANPPPAP